MINQRVLFIDCESIRNRIVYNDRYNETTKPFTSDEIKKNKLEKSEISRNKIKNNKVSSTEQEKFEIENDLMESCHIRENEKNVYEIKKSDYFESFNSILEITAIFYINAFIVNCKHFFMMSFFLLYMRW